jgi:hypothetical protein
MKLLFFVLGAISFSTLAANPIGTVSGRYLVITVTEENYNNKISLSASEGSDQDPNNASYVEVYFNSDGSCAKLTGADKLDWSKMIGSDTELNYYTGMGHIKRTEPARACVYSINGLGRYLVEEYSFETRRWED